MASDSDTELLVPSRLAEELRAAANEEHRPVLDVLRDAVDGYRREQRWRKTLAYGAERAQALGLTEDDVPRLIAEYRDEKKQGLHPT